MQQQLEAIARQYDLIALYAFGSRAAEVAAWARGEAVSPDYPGSDVDIGAQPALGRRLTAQERVRLTIDLEDLFDVSRVDLVVVTEAEPFLALEVIRGELLACTDLDAQAEFELYVLRRAADLAPYARERWARLLGEIPS